MTTPEALVATAESMAEELVELRRAIHRRPEVGLELPHTQGLVLDTLYGLDLEITLGQALSSVTAVLRGGRPGPTVLLRGDMDALPLTEQTGEEFSSQVRGAMHACGHDLHTAGLVGAARVLASVREQLAGDVVFMFQPGEEFDDGASLMLAEGVLAASGKTPVAAYALHASTGGVPGRVSTRAGALLASADAIDVVVQGEGGHGGSPAQTKDPVPAMAAIVQGFQALVSRTRPVEDPVVLSIGTIRAGVARNVVPDRVDIEGTLRSFSPTARSEMVGLIRSLAESTATGYGVRADVTITPGYPPTVNDADAAARMLAVAAQLHGEDRVGTLAGPSGGSEDFARVLERVPGAMAMYDVTPEDGSGPLHSPQARFDDRWLAGGAALLAGLAHAHLS